MATDQTPTTPFPTTAEIDDQIAHAREQITGWEQKIVELAEQRKTAAVYESATAYAQALTDGRTVDELDSHLNILNATHAAAFHENAGGSPTGTAAVEQPSAGPGSPDNPRQDA